MPSTKRMQPRTLNSTRALGTATLEEAWSQDCLQSESSQAENVGIATRMKLLLNSVEDV